MKHCTFKISALLFGATVAAGSAVALDRTEIQETARSSVLVTFLENSCNLAPSAEAEEQARQKFLQIAATRDVEGDSSWSDFKAEIDKAAVECASLVVKLPKEEFCQRLQDEFLSTGGTLVEKQ
jgi:hypothetical protein